MSRQYNYEDQIKIEDTLRLVKNMLCEEVGVCMGTIKIFSNGDVMSNFLIDEDGSHLAMDIKKDGDRVEKEHFKIEDDNFLDRWRE